MSRLQSNIPPPPSSVPVEQGRGKIADKERNLEEEMDAEQSEVCEMESDRQKKKKKDSKKTAIAEEVNLEVVSVAEEGVRLLCSLW